ncbi:toprim domain-containing protein [Dyadobacter sp. CY312]|uniref:toprim domain-containing protein n=1 Tax=Dyadobacter sp. CY312 TaxID=2907303 RepID=UPI001F46F92E|nr:toprim domain-containing protein [Dyadobacter sp. CY312]MCE7043830.1 toprim domain-containing protein [Dyadobacter sp. CY312]
MDFRERRLTIAEAKEMDMVDYLSSLGHEPTSIKGNSHWFLSPLHDENTPSFTINRNRNIWYDFGLGKGGSIIDFGVLYHRTTIPEFLQLLSVGNTGLIVPLINHKLKQTQSDEGKIKITRESVISSPSLLNYLHQRGISISIAELYCKEVRFESNGKNYYGIGFPNDAGGYEIRNQYFKGSSSPKGITTLKSGSYSIAIFEGFFDFLSYKTLQDQLGKSASDYLILNSLSFFEKSLTALDDYKVAHLYLDNNIAGQKCVQSALSKSNRFKDESSLYAGFDDLNDFLLTRQKAPVKKQRRGLRPG